MWFCVFFFFLCTHSIYSQETENSKAFHLLLLDNINEWNKKSCEHTYSTKQIQYSTIGNIQWKIIWFVATVDLPVKSISNGIVFGNQKKKKSKKVKNCNKQRFLFSHDIYQTLINIFNLINSIENQCKQHLIVLIDSINSVKKFFSLFLSLFFF